MKKMFGLILLAFNILVTNCASVNNEKKEEMILRITFANGFYNDSLSLYMNSCEIINNYVLSSDNTSDEITDLQISFFVKDGYYVAKIFQGEDILCKKSDSIELEIILNGHSNKSIVSLNKGAFISIDKENNQLKINQTPTALLYD
ncbi:MAG: hypothetical protein ACKO67_01340 [Bacteroidota bacterium]